MEPPVSEALYCGVVQQPQLQNFRATMKKYLQSAEVKDWMRFKRRKSVQMIHPAPLKDDTKTHTQEQLHQRHSSPSNSSVDLDCRTFPKHRNQNVENLGNRSKQPEQAREFGPVAAKPSKPASSNRKVDNEPETSQTLPELGRFRKRIETTKTHRRSLTTLGCEGLTPTRRSSGFAKPQSPQVDLPPTKAECSSTFFHFRNTNYDYDGIEVQTRPASMTLRRELNCSTLIAEVKRQRALDARLQSRNRERLSSQIVNAPIGIVILKSNKPPPSAHNRVAPNSRSLDTTNEATAILQDALEALECAHRWNEWGARTLRQLARASKAAAEKSHDSSVLGWHPRRKPEILLLLPHDHDIGGFTRQAGRVLESREEERVVLRDLLDAHLQHDQHVVQRPYVPHKRRRIAAQGQRNQKKKKLVDGHILHDFVAELLRHELVLRECARPGMMREHEHLEGQALVQKVWNKLQTFPSPASGGTCTALVQLVLQRDLQAQETTLVEVAEVVRELEEIIYQSLMQELLEELKQAAVRTR